MNLEKNIMRNIFGHAIFAAAVIFDKIRDVLMVSYTEIYVFLADILVNKDNSPGIWLPDTVLFLLCSRWTDFNETSQEASTLCPLPSTLIARPTV